MPILILLVGLLVAWAWWSGRLRQFTLDDAISAAVFLLGARMLATGKVVTGAVLMAGGLLYSGYRRGRFASNSAPMPLEDARRLLGVTQDASLADIRAAHRRLITRVHPDAGGSDELARRINAARDTLIADRMRTAPPRRDPLS